MTTYEYMVYNPAYNSSDRYRMDLTVYERGTVTAPNRNQAIEKTILKVGMNPKGHILEIRTKNRRPLTLFFTQRPVEPWGWQWSESTISYKDGVRNYHIHNGHVYYVIGMGMTAHRLNQ